MAAGELGLRERKKQKTRDLIVRVALRLFLAQGYDGTTVAEIAEAADISPRTFFGYFPSKEEVVFADDEAILAAFAERIANRPAGENAFDALRAWVVESQAAADFTHESEKLRRKLIRETPSLQVRERAGMARIEQVLAVAVAEDLGVDEDSLRPHLVAAAAIAGLDRIARLADETDGESLPESAAEVLDEALVFLQGGLAALRASPGRA